MEIKNEKLYRLSEIADTDMFPFGYRYLLRLIHARKLKAVVIGNRKRQRGNRYFVRGEDLNNFYNKITNERN